MAYNATKEIKKLADTMSKEWDLPIGEFYTEEIEYIGMIVQVCNDDVREVLGLTPVDH